jgi:three-Cys-motif partner protein
LERYLDIVSRGVSAKWAGRLSYIDLFSGRGKSIVRGGNEEIDGSPLIALKYGFSNYVFIDTPEIIAVLEKRLAPHAKHTQISFVEGDCNYVIQDAVIKLPPDHLTLAFIDPTGLQIQFETIRRLVHNRKVDLLMTIQFGMGIRMNLPQYLETQGAALTEFLGNTDWRGDSQQGGSISQMAHRVMARYMRQLEALGYIVVRDCEVPIHNDQTNSLLYYMVLASRYRLGEEFWRKITKIRSSGQRVLDLGGKE